MRDEADSAVHNEAELAVRRPQLFCYLTASLETRRSNMVLNVIEPSQTRYIEFPDDLENFLRKKFEKEHPGFNFQIKVLGMSWQKGGAEAHFSSTNATDGTMRPPKQSLRYNHCILHP